jgi:hypothetical protein
VEEGHRHEIHVGSPELLLETTSRWDLMGVSVSVRIEAY